MISTPTNLLAGAEASMLADIAQLTPDPDGLGLLLAELGYQPTKFGTGLFAPGQNGLESTGQLALLFPSYVEAELTVRKRELVGRYITRSGAIAAGLAALRTLDRRPPLLFAVHPHAPPPSIRPDQVVSLESGVVPRIWRRCFGSFDVLARITGQRPHPGLTNTAVNAIESSIPILHALLRLKADLQARSMRRGHFADAPLQPRLTLSAAHGGSRGSVLPVVFDILLTRRYDPAENMDVALQEITAVMTAAAPGPLGVEISVTHHEAPLPDPELSGRSREERALATGWGWPQTRFSTVSRLMPGATVLGGLERPDHDLEAGDTFTTLDAIGALARTLQALLAGD